MKSRAFALETSDSTPKRVRVAVVGARGYAGVELARILLRHPGAELKACFATSSFRLADFLPEAGAEHVLCQPVDQLFDTLRQESIETVFLATPVETSLELAPRLLETGLNVIDLSGAFRLQQGGDLERADTYMKWYGTQHMALSLLSKAEFGLVPWVETEANMAQAKGPRLIANPGCFSTAVLMAILPLLRDGLIDPQSLVIDAKSGTSGAGRKAEERLLHCEVDGNCLPYRIGRHQHEPEIRQFALRLAGQAIEPFFTTHLLPVRRGIIASIYARVSPGFAQATDRDIEASLAKAFASAYGEDPLVKVASLSTPEGERLLSLRRVVGSARTHIAFKVVDGRLYVFSLIDNLLKGAASQAVENFNRTIGAQASAGLTEMEGVL